MTEELKPIDVSKYTVTESGNVIRTDNKETLKNALEKIEELEKENAEAKDIIEDLITKIPASLVAHFESEKERAEKFLGWE